VKFPCGINSCTLGYCKVSSTHTDLTRILESGSYLLAGKMAETRSRFDR